MIHIPAYKGSIAVYGLGVSGLASVRALIAGGTKVLAWDDNPACCAAAQKLGAQINDMAVLTADIEALVLSPGVALTHPAPHPVVVRARAAGIPIIGDMTLFSRSLEMAALETHALKTGEQSEQDFAAPVIGVTGTNGKSTVTALTAHLLNHCGFDAQMGGNIGQPVMALNMPQDNTVYVIEMSSYQLALTPDFAADVAILLNITPDHIDRHGSFENYRQTKWQLLENLTATDVAIISTDFAARDVAKLTANIYRVSGDDASDDTSDDTSDNAPADIYASGSILHDEQGAVVDLSAHLNLQGAHNLQNAAAAFAAMRVVGASREKCAEGFADFAGLAHRLQYVGAHLGVRFINDSKATNAEATSKALAAFSNIYWIAGGVSKAGGITPALPFLAQVRKGYLIGEAADEFAQSLAPHIPVECHETLQQAVAQAALDALASKAALDAHTSGEDAEEDDTNNVVLFSPACASFDQFDNFETRGAAFCAAVANVTAEKAPIESVPTERGGAA